MGDVLGADFTSEKCIFCGKLATKLCDFVLGTARWAGHPPRYITGGIHNSESPMSHIMTCDRPICDKCAIHINESFDICPKHYEEIKKAGGDR